MSPESTVELDDKNWEQNVEKGDKPVMVMFYSPMCPYCQQITPYFEEYAQEFKDEVIFAKVNVLNSPAIVSRYSVMGTPTFKFFCSGRPIQEFTGAVYPTLLKKTVLDGLNHGPKCVKNTTWIDPGYA